MILGPAILHFAVVVLCALFRGLVNGIPTIARAFKRLAVSVYHRPSLLVSFLWDCICRAWILTLLSLPLVMISALTVYLMDPQYSQMLQRHPFLSRRWWISVRRVYRLFVGRYRTWIYVDIKFWRQFFPLLLRRARSWLEVWYTLNDIQKMVRGFLASSAEQFLIHSSSLSWLRPSYIMATIISYVAPVLSLCLSLNLSADSSPLRRGFRYWPGSGDDDGMSCVYHPVVILIFPQISFFHLHDLVENRLSVRSTKALSTTRRSGQGGTRSKQHEDYQQE
jgi:hypothetical protein